MMHVALRFDDPSISSNHKLENDVIAICSHFGIKIYFAVIPYKNIDNQITPLTNSAASHLIDAEENGLIEISQHGHSHQNNAPVNDRPSEFKGRPIKEQIHLLSCGKVLLDGIFEQRDRGFVPPWNSFDNNTLLAAKQLNFGFVSGGWEIQKNHKSSGMKIIPRTGQVSHLNNDSRKYKVYSALSPIIIAVLHHYDFVESGSRDAKFNLLEFGEIIEAITSTRNLTTTSLNSVAKALTTQYINFGHFTHHIITNKINWRLRKYMPMERLISHYMHNIGATREDRDINDALLQRENNPYIIYSQYFFQITQFLEYFDKEMLLVITTEQLRDHRQETLNKVFDFIDVDNSLSDWPEITLHTRESKKEWNGLGRLVRNRPRYFNRYKYYLSKLPASVSPVVERLFCQPIKQPVINQSNMEYISNIFANDLSQLQQHLGIHIPDWTLTTGMNKPYV